MVELKMFAIVHQSYCYSTVTFCILCKLVQNMILNFDFSSNRARQKINILKFGGLKFPDKVVFLGV